MAICAASLAISDVLDAGAWPEYRWAMRSVLVVDGPKAEAIGESIASGLRARGYQNEVLGPDRAFDREVRSADLIVVGFPVAGLLGGRAPATTASFVERLPPLGETPAAVFCVGGARAEGALASITDGLAVRGALVLVARTFRRGATSGVAPFVDAFLEAIAERRGG